MDVKYEVVLRIVFPRIIGNTFVNSTEDGSLGTALGSLVKKLEKGSAKRDKEGGKHLEDVS